MASQPDLPESILLSQFTGIRNTVSEERLQLGDLSAAVNVDIDDAGQLRRRRGYVPISAGHHHSLAEVSGRVVVVRDGTLGFLDAGLRFDPIVEVGTDPLAYTSVGTTIYYSSRSASGKIVNGQPQPWGDRDGAGQWISPVIRPTETLGAIAGRMLSAPPLATEIELYKGRIYLASGPVVWATELYLYDLVDKNRNYVLLEDDVTMLAAVGNGLYVGTARQLLFLGGVLSKGLQLQTVLDTPVLAGSMVQVPLSKVHPQARQGPVPEGDAPVFMTGAGICLGLDGGEVFNLTQGRVVFPQAQRVAALYREDQGANSYLAVADSAGGPGANARIGDYVDAEIVRASQRGRA